MVLLMRGFMHYLRDHNFDLRGGWGVRRTLTRLELPKYGFPARNCLCGGLGHVDRNAYAWAYAMHLSPNYLRRTAI